MYANADNVAYPRGFSYQGRRFRKVSAVSGSQSKLEWEATSRRLGALGEAGWGMVIKFLEKASGHRRGLGSSDFHIAATTKELVCQKSRVVRDEMEALIQTVMAKGSYVAREDAARALHAVVGALQDRLSSDGSARVREPAGASETQED